MSDSKDGKKDSSSLADDLIQEALENLDKEQELLSVDDPRDNLSESKERIAKIDPKQFVEKEAYMRLAADFDNFRKRALKERSEWERLGKEKAIKGALDLVDNLARGLSQAGNDTTPLATGVQMVLSQAEAWLQQEGLQRVPAVGEKFDPAIHEAVAQVEDAEKEDGTVVEELKRGYRWSDRLLRPASVVVVKSSAKQA
jgi:molecular chaperone GrpE